jgi:hypothetical protein
MKPEEKICDTCEHALILPQWYLTKCKLEQYGEYVNGKPAYRDVPKEVLAWNKKHGCGTYRKKRSLVDLPSECPICGGGLMYISEDYGYCIDRDCEWSTKELME